MATLIPAISSCVSRMTGGERRLAERLEQKLDGYLLGYDLPVDPKSLRPNSFCHTYTMRCANSLGQDNIRSVPFLAQRAISAL